MESKQMGAKEIAQLLLNMLAPKKGERLLFITDYPAGRPDSKKEARWGLLTRYYKAAGALSTQTGFRLLPIARYAETGKPNADLPKAAATHDGGRIDDLPSLIASCDIVIAMNEFSATAPLTNIAKAAKHLRVVSMPGVTSEMEGAMSADYVKMHERGKRLLAVVSGAAGFEITFDGSGVPRGTKLHIDTRANNWILDDGVCHKAGDFINFPSGELFTSPYEGISPQGRSKFGDSQTAGMLPVYSGVDGKIAFLKIEKNRIVRVQGDSEAANRIIEDIARDENNANIAELGLGINEAARSGEEVPVLEREKAGPHIAYGRNDHFGTEGSMVGKVAASTHVDFVYAHGCPITATIHAVYANGNRLLIAERGKIVAV